MKEGVTRLSNCSPPGGSYFVEWMTDKMEAGAEDYFAKIEVFGGVVRDLRSRRDAGRVRECLDRIKLAAEKNENVMPHLIAGAHAYCTLGEMVNVLKKVYSEYEEPVAF
ncbi:MAG: methylmalonyl-CoA mutase family protein [bacterium]|nr:methylmalonyl-CoA mutase family protein [bacterium]